ncbi:MAG TPA: hypothetical protein VIN56_08510 [Candidatus Dormibacteraeota bacterium]|jgi:hypothetical protein
MAIVIRLPGLTQAQYDKISEKLMPTAPPGLLVHVSFGEGDNIEGFQVWESQEAWAGDMGRVLPVLQENGVGVDTPPTPMPVVAMQGSKLSS